VVDNFIWINRKKFYGNLIYKFKILKEIHDYGFEIAIETTYSREVLFGDEIVRVSGAAERIGNSGSLDKHAKWKRNLFSDKWYTKLISSNEDNLFEFYRNKEFFENLLETGIDIKKPSIDAANISYSKLNSNKYIVLFPGGSSVKRRWDINNYLKIARYILINSDYDIVIDGSKKEIKLAQYIWDNLKSERVFITAGSTSLPEMAKLLSSSDLLISNETSAVHFAAAVGTPFICISNGAFYNRFHPYPRQIFNESYYLYPDEIMNNGNFNRDKYRFDSFLDINQIKPDDVKIIIQKLFKEKLNA
jgi:ADP-heptose:LPS heptosyltransferase